MAKNAQSKVLHVLLLIVQVMLIFLRKSYKVGFFCYRFFSLLPLSQPRCLPHHIFFHLFYLVWSGNLRQSREKIVSSSTTSTQNVISHEFSPRSKIFLWIESVSTIFSLLYELGLLSPCKSFSFMSIVSKLCCLFIGNFYSSHDKPLTMNCPAIKLAYQNTHIYRYLRSLL